MRLFSHTSHHKKIAIGSGILILCSFVFIAAVFAIQEEETIHVFPTKVSSENWMSARNAMEQTLGPNALFEDFDRDNAAFVILSEGKEIDKVIPDEKKQTSSSTATSTTATTTAEKQNDTETENDEGTNAAQEKSEASDVGPDSTEQTPEAEVESNQGIEPMEDISMHEYLFDVSKGFMLTYAWAQEELEVKENDHLKETNVPEEAAEGDAAIVKDQSSEEEVTVEGSDEIEQEQEATNTSTTTQETETTDETDREVLPDEDVPENEEENRVPESEHATNTVATSSESELQIDEEASESGENSDISEDVRVCKIRGIECYTLTFEGFDIGSILSEETVTGYTLNLSLAATSDELRFTDDKVLVRYFYRGAWHLAGEIAIQDVNSNFKNGGYFTFALPDLVSWDALRDFKVELEFVRQSNVRTEFYLDSVWVDTTYHSNSEEKPFFPDNVLEDLIALEESRRGDVFRMDETVIELPYATTDGGDLVVRANETMMQSPGTGEVYFSVTNISDVEKDFSLSFYMPDKQGEPQMLRQWMHNIPSEREVVEHGVFAQYCEAGWVKHQQENEQYTCEETNTDVSCDELNDDATNCIQNNVEIDRRTEIAYKEGWDEHLLHTEDFVEKEDESFVDRVRRWFGIGRGPKNEEATVYADDKTFTIAPDQTLFFSSRLEYPLISTGAFAIMADTKDDRQALDISWESNWRYRIPIEIDRSVVGDTLTVELDADDYPHIFSHVADWSHLFIREKGLHSAVSLPYTHEVKGSEQVTLSIDVSSLSQQSTFLELYYREEKNKKDVKLSRGEKVFINPDALTLGKDKPQEDVEVSTENTNAIAQRKGYTLGTAQEVILEEESSHRLLLGTQKDNKFPEDGKLLFSYRSNKRDTQEGMFVDVPTKQSFKISQATLTRAGADVVPNTVAQKTESNEWILNTGMEERTFKPGKYTLEVEVVEGDKKYTDTLEFYWGVLTWNTTKSVYEVGETAEMHIAALTDTGNTICDATLTLLARSPSGEEQMVPVTASGACQGNNVVSVPDYAAQLVLSEVGEYEILLQHLDENGSVVHELEDSIVVQDSTPYVIERSGPTRIYPVEDYTMSLLVSAENSFVGTVREVVPASFDVYNYGDARLVNEGTKTYLEWEVALLSHEQMELSYSFDAPDISPYVYRLGPASFGDNFTELREWQIASDATGNMLLLWDDGNSIPAGWSCVSCAPGDPFYQRFIMGSSTYNSTGGATTHSHSATGNVDSLGVAATESQGSGAIEVAGHTHTYIPTISSENNLPSYRQLRVIRFDTAGEPATLPTGAIVYFDANVPSGWTRYAAQDGYFVYGENTPGTTGGTSTHSHTLSGSTGISGGGSVGSRGGGTQASAASDAHAHTVSGATTYGSNEPPYVEMVLGKLDATSSVPNSMVGMWTDEVPSGWVTMSSSTEVLENKFIRPASSYGASGGTSTHAHSDVIGLTSSEVNDANGRAGSAGAGNHSHNVDVTDFSTQSHLPPYATAVFGKRFSNEPVYTQNYYRFYANENAEPPTDPWPAGGTDLGENTRITTSEYTSKGDVVRIRMSVNVTNATATAYTDAFKLQYAEGSTCSDSGLLWYDVAPQSSSTAPWRGYNNSSVSDGATLSSTTLSVSDVFETYEEENPSASSTNDIEADQDGEWDWVVEHNDAKAGTDYCFRMVESDGSRLSLYNYYPQLITNEAPTAPSLLAPFDNEKASSTVPTFTFTTTDPEGDAIHYQIQIDEDALFGSPIIDVSSISSPGDFDNLDTPADKSPFNSGDTMAFVPSTSLSNNTTYWWRVRGRDTSGSDNWGEWSDARSVTIDTSTTISTWYQTTDEQFDTDMLVGVESSAGSDQVSLITGSSTGTITSTEIDFDWRTTGNAWGYVYFTDTEVSSDIKYQVEFYDSVDTQWELIPDSALPGNSTGFDTSGVSLLSLDTTTYSRIRLKGTLTNSGSSPILADWAVEWGSRVQQPTLSKLFDNEKTGTTTPSFEFYTTDPQDDDLVYEINWSTDYAFTSGVTSRVSDTNAGFQNIASSTDTSPFVSGDSIRFTVQAVDALSNNTTYWWRIRAKDPNGGDTWSDWSEKWSFTVDTAVVASTWFQTVNEQFEGGNLYGITALGNNAEVATSVSDVLLAYGEGTSETPKYRFWDGSSWGSESSALNVGNTQYWVVTRAHPTAEAYALATIGGDADVNVQLYEDGSWGNLQEMTTTISNTNARGVDMAYESISGDLVAVYCDGDADPSYRVYNESTGWGTVGAVNLASTNNCEWVRLAADPTSDELILVVLDAGGTQYEAQVWNGASWGNSTIQGSMSSSHEGMAVMYEESGDQAILITSDGNAPKIRYNTWNGTSWGTAGTVSIGNDFEWGNLTRDDGTDQMLACYIDEDNDIGVVRWTGSAWTGQTELETVGKADTDRPVDCVFETEGARDGYGMVNYSDDTNARYQSWNGTAWSGEASVSTITDSATIQSVRSDDGQILSLFFDDTNGRYDFSNWNGSTWSSPVTLESSPSVTGSPYKEPFMMAPRNSAVSGTLYSPEIDYSDGSGPQWDQVSWTDSEPGASTLLYQIQYYDTSSSGWELVPDGTLPGNSTGTSTSPIDISNLNTVQYSKLRIKATFACNAGNCPTLNDWAVTWSEGFTVSGVARAFDQSTAVTTGTVAVAVNGALQIGKTGVISSGSWTVSNITAFEGDVLTIWIDGADESNEAVAVTKYDGNGSITGVHLYERHVTIGSDDNPTISNADLASYDNSVSGNEDILHDVDTNNDLYVCASTQATCGFEKLWIRNNTTFEPATSSSEFIHAHDIEIEGTVEGDSNTFEVSGSWINEGIFTADTSTIVFDATSTSESIDSTSATTSAYYDVVFGQGASTATWSLASPLDVNGSLEILSGTLAPGAGYEISVAQDYTIGIDGLFTKNTGTTTFDGTVSSSWSDLSSPQQDIGTVVIDGTSKTVSLATNVLASTVVVGVDDTFVLGGNTVELTGSFDNNGSFVPQLGEVLFTSNGVGNTVDVGGSSFYDLTFNGNGGNWSFPSGRTTISNDLHITEGVVTMPNGTSTIGGSLTVSGGTLVHNNGLLYFTSNAAETITASTSSFFDLKYNGNGTWTITDINATTSNDVSILSGQLVLPSGVFAVGGSLYSTAGTCSHSGGTVRLFSNGLENLSTNNSSLNNLIVDGSGADVVVTDADLSLIGDLTVSAGNITFPAGTLRVGGSLTNSGGSFTHNNGTVLFNASTTGHTVTVAGSDFYDVVFNDSAGGWSFTDSATSTNDWSILAATSLVAPAGGSIEVQGDFLNEVGGSATDWTNATLFLNSATSSTINTKLLGGDGYSTLQVGAGTDIKMWHSSSSNYVVSNTGSLYSQDHNAVDGDLYVWGSYERATGTEYWNYSTDFDGTDLSGGNERTVHVAFADGANAAITDASIDIVGTSAATTSIDSQSGGSYGITISEGVVNAQYYSFMHLNTNGVTLLGSTTVTDLSNGSFTLGVNGGTLVRVSSSTLDTNAAQQFSHMHFATTSSITGFNVGVIGTPSSYWTFKDHTGNLSGESFDSDPGGNPGNLRWDDSAFNITISGTVYPGEGTGVPSFCDNTTPVVYLKVDGVGSYSASCDASTGEYSIPGVSFSGDASLVAYIKASGTSGSTVTKTPNGDIADLDIYEHRVIVRHEDSAPLSIADMLYFDNDDDADVPFTASTGTPNTLVLEPETMLYVWKQKEFRPAGNITLTSGGSGASYDGSIQFASSSIFTAQGTETHSIGGSWIADETSAFVRAESTVVFTATTSGKKIAPASVFNDVSFTGSGGVWTIASSTTVSGTVSPIAGTVTGSADLTIFSGPLVGSGAFNMTGGTVTVLSGSDFGGTNDWVFNNLIFSTSTATTTTKTGSGDITIHGTLTVGANNTLAAGGSEWIFSGSGSVFQLSGTFLPQTSTTTYNGSSDLTVTATDYNNVTFAPSAGSPTYTIEAGNFSVNENMYVGSGSAVTVTANTNDPLIAVLGDVAIRSNATYQAADSNDLFIGGSFDNNGTFSANTGGVIFNSLDTGETVSAGGSSLHHVYFRSNTGGWSIDENLTATGNFSISSSSDWTLLSGQTLEVQGMFTNYVGGASTTWTGSTLYLNSGTSYSINSSSYNGDSYDTLSVGAHTDPRMWYSTSNSYAVDATGSLYSQDHAGVDGDLYIFGEYTRTAGSDYWSYATDFDGTNLLGGNERTADVYIADGSGVTLSGGTLEILGTSTATTTISNQGSGTYSVAVTGGTINAMYYALRNMDSAGLDISGNPTVTSLSNGDFELAVANGSLITVAASAITANPLKIMYDNRFATSSGATSGSNVTATGVTGSSWRFTTHTGGFDGENYDTDPGGDPGYIIWDDSAAQITLSGNVLGVDESSVSSVCDGSTQVVRFLINGANPRTTSCNAGTGYYEFTNIVYNVGDVFTVYLDTNGGAQASNVTIDPITNITDMHLYEDRAIVRHESGDPVTINDLSVYDSDQDSDIPFDADAGSPGTLTVLTGGKLIVWDGKTLAPGGNITIASLGSGTSYDGDLELKTNASFTTAGTESHTVGGSFISGTGATLNAGANTTFTFTSTSTETIDTNDSSFGNITFNGNGGGWTFSESNATTTGDVTITSGSVTLATSTFAVGGSFINNDTFTGASTTFTFTSAGTETIVFGGADVGSINFTGSGSWLMSDTNATSTGSVHIHGGSVSLPAGIFAVRTSFENDGASFYHSGTLNLYGDEVAQTLSFGSSTAGSVAITGAGSWIFGNTQATTTGSITLENGGLTAPVESLAIGGSLTSNGTFNANAGTLYFFATTSGNTIDVNGAVLGSVLFDGAGGGWTVSSSATSTSDWRLKTGSSFTMATGTVLEVGGEFENTMGGLATDWTNAELYLNASGTTFSINEKNDTGDTYAFLTVGANTNVSMWNSQSATTSVDTTGYLYSQDHGNNDGDLYVYGAYTVSAGTEYWNYDTDFDGTALGGGSRAVHVRIASSSVVEVSGGTLEIIGAQNATSSIDVIGAGGYTFSISGGTLNAQYYSFAGMDVAGVQFSNSPTITTLANGAYELSVNGGSMITVASSTINNNPSRTFNNIYFEATGGVSAGYNINLSGSTNNVWQFTNHKGNYDGEDYDNDGADDCGQIRWSNSACLEVSQTQYRFRSDDGGEGAPDSTWYDSNWDKRRLIKIFNTNGGAVTDYAFKIEVPYDADMQADFDDLRFTDSSGTTPLSYWVEDVQLSATATAWVKIPTLEANEVNEIYMYYGNALATNAESGTSTFTFFDDFEDADIAEYSGSAQDITYFDTSTSHNYEGTYGLAASGGNTDKQTAGGIYRTDTTFSQNSTIRFFQKIAAGTDDEPCALFGVQGSGQNYAVCLDQYPTDRVVISEDVTSNSDDGSATELASTDVSWSSGWYEVEIDWLENNNISVSVYDSTGSVFATTSVTDSTYTSGGMGFSFWYQSEGWDFYSVRPYVAADPVYTIGASEQIAGGATWKAAQNTILTGQSPNENFRVRFTIENTGTQIAGQTWRLQYAPKSTYGACEGVPSVSYNDVPNQTSCGISPVCMTASTQITDQEISTESLSTDLFGTFVNGHVVESPSNQTNSMTLEQDEYTEVEYAIEFTDYATESNYCLRTTNGGVEVDTYLRVAEASVRFAPVISNWNLNNNQSIALTEGNTKTVYATGTVSDLNGFSDILYATTTIYRSGVGESCLPDDNNCYRLNSLQCPFTNCSGNSCDITCTADIQFFAEPTDSGSSYDAEKWEAYIYTVDTTGNVATSTSDGVEMLTLWGIDVLTGDISYGNLGVAQDTGNYNATSTVRNTGNDAIDVDLVGTDLSSGASSIPVGNQRYATDTFAYSSCTICSALSGSASTLEVDLQKPASTTPVTDDIYWGIYVPTGVEGTTHYGQNTFIATGD